jgi:hypothetical protein
VRAAEAQWARKHTPGRRWLDALGKYHRTLLSIRADGGAEDLLWRLPRATAHECLQTIDTILMELSQARAALEACARREAEEGSDGSTPRLEAAER